MRQKTIGRNQQIHLGDDFEDDGYAGRDIEACLAGIGSRDAHRADDIVYEERYDRLVGYVQNDILQHANDAFAAELVLVLVSKYDIHRYLYKAPDPGEIFPLGKPLYGQIFELAFRAAAAAADELQRPDWLYAGRLDVA
jgi:hypothetical protein